jgi:hypothetical protein
MVFMTHGEVSEQLKLWFKANKPGWYLFQNSTGYASAEHVHYGVPHTGGGADYFAFGPGGVTEFYEVKTNGKPTLQKNQKAFVAKMEKQGFKCFVYKEGYPEPVRAQEYRPYKKWPY